MRNPALPAVLAALLIGCGPAPAPTDSAGIAGPSAADASAAAPAATGQGPSFGPFRKRLDELLTRELAAEIAGLPADAAEKGYIDGLPQIDYAWPSERTEEYAGMQLAKKNRVSIAHVQTDVTPQLFRSQFVAPPSESEPVRANEALARQASERGLDAAQAGAAGGLVTELAKARPSQELSGIGDAAVWETGEHEQVLYVLLNGSSIRMTVDISDDPDTNREAAVALARRLIDRL